MKDNTKNKLHRLELLLAVSLVIVVVGVSSLRFFDFSGSKMPSLPLITGFVTSDVITQSVDLAVVQSQVFDIFVDESFVLTSLKLGGVVEGSGLAQVFLEGPDGRFLVFSNVKDKQRFDNLITGKVVMELVPGEVVSAPDVQLVEDQEFVSGPFYNVCVDTCFVSLPFSSDKNYKFVFFVGEDTKLRIDKILYTTS